MASSRQTPATNGCRGQCLSLTPGIRLSRTTTLLAVLNVLTGELIGRCYSRRRHGLISSKLATGNEWWMSMSRSPRDDSDSALVVAIGRWRQEALAEAYRRHGGAVFALARRVLGDRIGAEDVTQLVFSALWESPDRFDPERGSLRAFLLTMAHRRAVDLVRADGRRRQREERSAGRAEPAYDLEHEVWDLTVAERVREALSELSGAERRVIEMAYFEGYTYREVASLLGEPEGTVKSRIRLGLQRLRAALVDVGSSET